MGASYSVEFQVNPDVLSFISVFLNVSPFSACVSTELDRGFAQFRLVLQARILVVLPYHFKVLSSVSTRS